MAPICIPAAFPSVNKARTILLQFQNAFQMDMYDGRRFGRCRSMDRRLIVEIPLNYPDVVWIACHAGDVNAIRLGVM
jgi:hypothetical protein